MSIEEIKTRVRQQFAFLIGEFGFKEPQVQDQRTSSTFRYLDGELALEVEVEYCQFFIFVLVVKLEEGRLPQGYYQAKGTACRLHLQDIIKKFGLLPAEECDVLRSLARARAANGSNDANEEMMIKSAATLLHQTLGWILANNEKAFESHR